MNYSELLPEVIRKNNNKEFNPKYIYNSLLKETSIDSYFAKRITNNVCRFLVVSNLQIITAPLIREIVNIELLKLGFEKERLQNTRIGFPYYDLIHLTENFNNMIFKNQYINKTISKHVLKEFNEVKKLIENNDKK